jgi:hypothetical protein
MSDPENRAENFLQRWSRRKRTAEPPPRGSSEPPESANADMGPETGRPADAGAQGKTDLPAFDPATLPSIDSITATTDIRAFLAPDVPEELARAALRRTWVTDPAIRDFVGLAENQWDFTKPESVPGFGSLELTPELRRVLMRLLGDAPKGSQERPPIDADNAPLESVQVNPTAHQNDNPTVCQNDHDATKQTESRESAAATAPAHRKHGGALPK